MPRRLISSLFLCFLACEATLQQGAQLRQEVIRAIVQSQTNAIETTAADQHNLNVSTGGSELNWASWIVFIFSGLLLVAVLAYGLWALLRVTREIKKNLDNLKLQVRLVHLQRKTGKWEDGLDMLSKLRDDGAVGVSAKGLSQGKATFSLSGWTQVVSVIIITVNSVLMAVVKAMSDSQRWMPKTASLVLFTGLFGSVLGSTTIHMATKGLVESVTSEAAVTYILRVLVVTVLRFGLSAGLYYCCLQLLKAMSFIPEDVASMIAAMVGSMSAYLVALPLFRAYAWGIRPVTTTDHVVAMVCGAVGLLVLVLVAVAVPDAQVAIGERGTLMGLPVSQEAAIGTTVGAFVLYLALLALCVFVIMPKRAKEVREVYGKVLNVLTPPTRPRRNAVFMAPLIPQAVYDTCVTEKFSWPDTEDEQNELLAKLRKVVAVDIISGEGWPAVGETLRHEFSTLDREFSCHDLVKKLEEAASLDAAVNELRLLSKEWPKSLQDQLGVFDKLREVSRTSLTDAEWILEVSRGEMKARVSSGDGGKLYGKLMENLKLVADIQNAASDLRAQGPQEELK